MNKLSQPEVLRRFVSSPLTQMALAIVVAIATLVGCGLFALQNTGEPVVIDNANLVTARFSSSISELKLEVAATAESRRVGLMNRRSLQPNAGMIFVFPTASERTFWMQNTFIPLDIIYLDPSFRVITIHRNTKPNQTTELYPSQGNAQYVVELAGGWSESNNLKIGDTLELRGPLF